jgi:hypothetical protein
MDSFEVIMELADLRAKALRQVQGWRANDRDYQALMYQDAIDVGADRLRDALRSGKLVARRNGVPLTDSDTSLLSAAELWNDEADPPELDDRAVWSWLPELFGFPFVDTPLHHAGAWIADQAGVFKQVDVDVDKHWLFYEGHSSARLDRALGQATEDERRRIRREINSLLFNAISMGELVLFGYDPALPLTEPPIAVPRERWGGANIRWWQDYAFVAGRRLGQPAIRLGAPRKAQESANRSGEIDPVVAAGLSAWMRARAATFLETHGSPIKRDIVLKDCLEAHHCTWRQALAAWNSVPAHLKGRSRQRRT